MRPHDRYAIVVARAVRRAHRRRLNQHPGRPQRIYTRRPQPCACAQTRADPGSLRRLPRDAGRNARRLFHRRHSAHLARQRLADLFLDTRCWNAHTTASDALWSGVPIITFPGEHLVSRLGVSLLHGIGLDELAVRNLDEYEALAIELATRP